MDYLKRFEKGCRHEGELYRELYTDSQMMLELLWQPRGSVRRLAGFEFVWIGQERIEWSRGQKRAYHSYIIEEGHNFDPERLPWRSVWPLSDEFLTTLPQRAKNIDSKVVEVIVKVLRRSRSDRESRRHQGKLQTIETRVEKLDGVDNCIALHLAGYIEDDTYNTGALVDRATKAIDAGYNKLVVDLSGVSFLSSPAMHALATLPQTVKLRGGDLVIVGIQPKVYECFQLLGFGDFFNIKDTLEEAVQFLSLWAGRPDR